MKKPPTPFSRTDLGHIFFLVGYALGQNAREDDGDRFAPETIQHAIKACAHLQNLVDSIFETEEEEDQGRYQLSKEPL